jgi:hypothetical protein
MTNISPMATLRNFLGAFPTFKNISFRSLAHRLLRRRNWKSNLRSASSESCRWKEIPHFIDNTLFLTLCAEFPDVNLFEHHKGVPRGPSLNQRPHDRYYLALDNSIYSGKSNYAPSIGSGIMPRTNLAESWANFIDYLESPSYFDFASAFLGTNQYVTSFAWHMAYSGCEVSPHLDARKKVGTHIFYFNEPASWHSDWGGQTVMLSDLRSQIDNPDFCDFDSYHEISNIGNNSLIWVNTALAWHGVRPISPPPGFYRKVFTVVFYHI